MKSKMQLRKELDVYAMKYATANNGKPITKEGSLIFLREARKGSYTDKEIAKYLSVKENQLKKFV